MNWRPFAPLREIRIIQKGMRRLFVNQQPERDDSVVDCHWFPAAGFYDSDHELVVNLDLLGLDPNTLDIRVENNVLTICGERRSPSSQFNGGVQNSQPLSPAFARSFRLSTSVDPKQIRTDCQAGVLRIVLPKTGAVHRITNTDSGGRRERRFVHGVQSRNASIESHRPLEL